MKAFTKDIVRTIRGSMKRFLSIVVICALGATMLTGLSMACIDLRAAASALYSSQHLFDISVQSTYGLTDEDIAELAAVDGVAQSEGGFEETTYTLVDGLRATITVKALLASGMNEPYVVEGRLPESADEVAVTEKYLKDSGKQIGDTLEFEDAEQDDPTGLSDEPSVGAIPGGTYTIVGTVVDPANITQPDGPVAFRASTSSDYTFFVSDRAVQDDATYTIAYLAVSGAEDLPAYSEAYDARVDEVQARVEDLAPQRERARARAIKDEAMAEIDDQEADALAELADAESELDDAQAEIDDGLAEAQDGQRELDEQRANALAELGDAQAQIDDGRTEAQAGIEQAQSGLATIAETRAVLEEQLDKIGALESGIAQAEKAVQLAQAGVSTAQAQGAELLDGLEQIANTVGMDFSPVRDAWNNLCSYSGLEEPIELEEAFTSAVKTFRDGATGKLQQLRTDAQSYQDMLEQRLAPQIERRTQVAERREDIEERTGAIDARVAQIAARLTQIDDTLASLEEDDPARADLLTERGELAEEQRALTEEENLLASEESALAEEQDVLNAQLAAYDQLAEQLDQLNQALTSLENISDAAIDQLAQGMGRAASGAAQANAAFAQLQAIASQLPGGIEGSRQSIRDGLAQLAAQETRAQEGLDTARSALAQLDAGQRELIAQRASALAQLADAQAQLDDALAQLADGQAELDDGRATFEEERDDALAQIADARADVDAVEPATWYVQNRSGLGSYSSVDSDASSIETIANIIPVIFYIVAILVSLTTATRMVEEERTLIGLYKALGYSKARILSKYLIYTATAALIGGILGDILGFVLIPYILFYIFQAMYLLPLFSLQFNLFYAVLGIAAFVIGIAGSTFITCRADLRETPAALMRPRAPRAGSRIFLEHIRPLWRRLGFLNKVTARNLFRYKKRFAMTVFGIMGCTALLVCGFSIKNTVESLAPRQYEDIYRYDLMAVTQTDDFEACQALLEDSSEVRDLQPLGIDNITVEFDGAKESMQLYVVPRGASIDPYVSLETISGEPIDLDEAGVVITNNAATVLDLAQGDTAQLTTTALDEADAPVNAITRNYLGNAVYMTQDAYEELFGEPLELTGFFAHLAGDNAEQLEFADELEASEDFLPITSTAKMHQQFEKSFTLINVVVYVIIGLAAGLAFVVLFTLSTVNIGEREREIATIKVLGFRVGEVRTYINKETFVLTLIGILVGLPAGWALSESFTYILKMPSIFFDVEVAPWCYALAAAFSVVFALVVSRITNRMLDRVNMVEALKSPE